MLALQNQFFKIISFTFILLTIVCTTGCFTNEDSKFIPDVSHIEVDLTIKRFEQDLLKVDTLNIKQGMADLANKYPHFFENTYTKHVLPLLQRPEIFDLFLRSPGIRHLCDTVGQVYGDFSDIEKNLEQSFKYHQYYFPKNKIPQVITYISEYSIGNFIADGELGIGLDFFLGQDYNRYNPNFFPGYIRRSMNKTHLVAKAMEAVADDLTGEMEGDRLLDYMIHNGKKMYVLDLLLPEETDSVKYQHTGDQIKWLKNNELQIWSYLIGEDMLYSTKYKDFRKLVDHSPNAPGMPPEAPGRTANWVGFQIVKAFMKRNPNITPDKLLEIKDAQKILSQSKYKPRR